MADSVIRPPRLRAGDRVIVVSPSSTIADQRESAERAASVLGGLLDLKLEFAPHALDEYFYSSGSAADRRNDLMAAFADPNVKAIFCSMGGATAIDVIEQLDYDAIASNPKVVAGISDCSTVLDAITARTGLVTFHGLELLDFAHHEMAYTTSYMRQMWFDRWSGEYDANPAWRDLNGDRTTYRGWREIKPGRAAGIAVGGNSDAFRQLVGTEYSPSLEGSILFLEAYRLQKRHLQALLAELRLREVFESIGGLIIGYCLGSDEPGVGNERDLADIVREVTTGYDFPAVQIGEIGHQVENLILPIGAVIEIDTQPLSLVLPDPTVT